MLTESRSRDSLRPPWPGAQTRLKWVGSVRWRLWSGGPLAASNLPSLPTAVPCGAKQTPLSVRGSSPDAAERALPQGRTARAPSKGLLPPGHPDFQRRLACSVAGGGCAGDVTREMICFNSGSAKELLGLPISIVLRSHRWFLCGERRESTDGRLHMAAHQGGPSACMVT